MKAHRSTLLELKLAFTEIGDGALRAVAAGERLRSVSLAGCFWLSRGALRAWMGRRMPQTVREVDLRWLVDVRVGWVTDMLARGVKQGEAGKGGSLEAVDISGCGRLTLSEVQSLEKRWPGVKVTNSASPLAEDSTWGCQRLAENPKLPLSGIREVASAVASPRKVEDIC